MLDIAFEDTNMSPGVKSLTKMVAILQLMWDKVRFNVSNNCSRKQKQ